MDIICLYLLQVEAEVPTVAKKNVFINKNQNRTTNKWLELQTLTENLQNEKTKDVRNNPSIIALLGVLTRTELSLGLEITAPVFIWLLSVWASEAQHTELAPSLIA